ncbi:MAG: hypothetical protein M3365_11495 [Gemmatimonadota bacterium]|nr:hypothetical protein [Gemmatimonadota bacterium]
MSKNRQLMWFAHVTDRDEAEQVDDLIDRALADLSRLSETLRASIDLHASLSFAQQTRRSENFQELATIVAAVLLVPTLVTGIYGANTRLPGGGSWLGFVAMVVAMVLSTVLTYGVIRSRQRRGGERRD